MLTFQQWGLGSIPTLAAKQEKSMKIDSKKIKNDKKTGENELVSTTIVEQSNVLS